MTPQESLDVLDRAAAQVQAVRAFHEQVVTAVKVLQKFVDTYDNDTKSIDEGSIDFGAPEPIVEDDVISE